MRVLGRFGALISQTRVSRAPAAAAILMLTRAAFSITARTRVTRVTASTGKASPSSPGLQAGLGGRSFGIRCGPSGAFRTRPSSGPAGASPSSGRATESGASGATPGGKDPSASFRPTAGRSSALPSSPSGANRAGSISSARISCSTTDDGWVSPGGGPCRGRHGATPPTASCTTSFRAGGSATFAGSSLWAIRSGSTSSRLRTARGRATAVPKGGRTTISASCGPTAGRRVGPSRP